MRKFKHKTTGNIAIETNSESNYKVSEPRNFTVPKWIVENSSDWEEIIEKDYEILSFSDSLGNTFKKDNIGKFTKGSGYFDENHGIQYRFNINSVKRLSDGEIFTIGDKIDGFGSKNISIESFIMENNIIQVWAKLVHGMNGWSDLNQIKRSKAPLFVTNDGVDKFNGDKCYYITPHLFSIGHGEIVAGSEFKMALARFHDKVKAEIWIEENKPEFSKKDMIQFAKCSRLHNKDKSSEEFFVQYINSCYNLKNWNKDE